MKILQIILSLAILPLTVVMSSCRQMNNIDIAESSDTSDVVILNAEVEKSTITTTEMTDTEEIDSVSSYTVRTDTNITIKLDYVR